MPLGLPRARLLRVSGRPPYPQRTASSALCMWIKSVWLLRRRPTTLVRSIRLGFLGSWLNRVVCLSTIGADAKERQSADPAHADGTVTRPAVHTVTFLRPGWFIDNAAWDVASAHDKGVIRSFLMPLDERFAMVAAKDVGVTAAALIQQHWTGVRVVELEGPARVSRRGVRHIAWSPGPRRVDPASGMRSPFAPRAYAILSHACACLTASMKAGSIFRRMRTTG
jgi:uncharacterized protein YbjT (DUF2867 family)